MSPSTLTREREKDKRLYFRVTAEQEVLIWQAVARKRTTLQTMAIAAFSKYLGIDLETGEVIHA